MIQRTADNIIQRIVELRRDIEELKTRQPIGSNQVVMFSQDSGKEWDITLPTNNAGQFPDSPGWNVAVITAEAVEGSNLVADLIPKYSVNMPIGGDFVEIPQPAAVSNRMQWYVPVFNTVGSSVSIKAQVVANIPVTITAERGG